MKRLLIIEDGFEYSELLGQFLQQYEWSRAGTGAEGLRLLQEQEFAAVFLDMRFDRCPTADLLGDLDATAERFNGDLELARKFLEDYQGNFVLAALRQAGLIHPVLLSYDFADEPGRWARLQKRFSPVEYLPDAEGPSGIASRFERMLGQ